MNSLRWEWLPAITIIALIGLSPLCSDTGQVLCRTLSLLAVPLLVLMLRLSKISAFAIVGLLVLQAQWGIAQFVFQQDLGMQLLGESTLSANTVAVAKFSVGDLKLIRAYGPYPHANVFGGIMVIALMLVMSFRQPIMRRWMLPLIVIGLLLSFSRSAYLGGIIVISIMNHQYFRRMLPIVLLVATMSPLLFFRFTDAEDSALSERLRGYAFATQIIANQPITQGAGPGTYAATLEMFLAKNNIVHQPWELAPVHSVLLLVFAELGTLPAMLLVGLLLMFITPARLVLLAVLGPPLLLDHYFLTNIVAFTLIGLLWRNQYVSRVQQSNISSV